MNAATHTLDEQSLLQKLQRQLHDSQEHNVDAIPLIAGIALDQQERVSHLLPPKRIPAAVLVPIVKRASELTLLFTERASHLKHHAGQICFPGGRIEAHDGGPLQAALRETEEEIGLMRNYISIVGYLPPQLIFTGYCVTPVIALIQPDFSLRIDTREVASVFEVPLQYLMNPAHHLARERQIGGITAHVYDLPYGEHHIWGATAGIVMNLYRLLAS